MSTKLQDSSTWLPLSGLEPGFAENKASVVDPQMLDGWTLTTVDESGTEISHKFHDGKLQWAITPIGETGIDDYEAFMIDDGLYYIQIHHEKKPAEAVSIIFDITEGTCLSVLNFAGEAPEGVEPGRTGVKQQFVPSIIVEHKGERGVLPHRTSALIGRRVRWQYSNSHVYEHVYLSENWYTWHCLEGPEREQADTDLCTYFELRKGIYVFAWREKVIPCASVTIADHRDITSTRSWGVLFGPDDQGEGYIHFTFGANGYLSSITINPETAAASS